jgi:hypothetical protein
LLAWLMVSDPAKGDALKEATASHGVQLAVLFVAGLITALISSRALRTRRAWPVRPSWLGRNPSAKRPTQLDMPQDGNGVLPTESIPAPTQPTEWRPTTGTVVPQPPDGSAPVTGIGVEADRSTGAGTRPVTTVRRGNGVVRGGLTKLIPTQHRRDEASKS